MKVIVKVSQVKKISHQLHQQNKKIILVGGCFDLVHLGHLTFLQKAKTKGDILIVLLESDKTIRRLKGVNRPINSQINRAKFLTHIKYIDFIILLPEFKTDLQYQELISQIKPDIIAITDGDPQKKIKEQQAKLVNAKLITVAPILNNQSSSSIIQKITDEN